MAAALALQYETKAQESRRLRDDQRRELILPQNHPELADAFEADAFHVGMDEVFLIGSEHCPRCKGGDPARLFAKAVNDLHRHIVKERNLELLLWGDRLLPAKELGYSSV